MKCCVTGHRPKGFPFERQDYIFSYLKYMELLEQEIECLIREGYTHFITGMAEGADLDFAKTVLFLRDQGEPITLEAALPYPLKPSKKMTAYSEARDDVLLCCNQKHIVSPYFHQGCMQKRNKYMVDQSDIVLAIWNGERTGGTWNTIAYAQTQNKTIRYILLSEL